MADDLTGGYDTVYPTNSTVGGIPVGSAAAGIGSGTPFLDKALGTLISLGSAAASVAVQNNEVNNAYKLAAIHGGVYAAPGSQYSAQTPWLNLTGVPSAPAAGQISTVAGFALTPQLLLLLAIAAAGVSLVARK